MKFCTDHWSALRAAIADRGLSHLVASSGEAAAARMVAELDQRAADATYDPLMAAHNMIMQHAMHHLGLYIFTGDYCPVCEFKAKYPPPPEGRYADNESFMIDGPADAVLAYCRERGLVH